MLKDPKLRLSLAVAGCLLLAQPLMAADAIKGNLVTTAWLAKNLHAADVLVLDSSPPQLYAKQHIPGAVPVDVFRLASFGVRDLPNAQIESI